MEDAFWARFARLAWVRGSLVKYVNRKPYYISNQPTEALKLKLVGW
jgi:hypothetical protein